MSRIAFQITLIIAFVVGSIAYWSALIFVSTIIWLAAVAYAVAFRFAKACLAFFQVLLANPSKTSKPARSGSW